MKRVLIANRGEIAVRIIRTCRRLGIETVLVVSEADKDSGGAALADRVVVVGPARATDSYLRQEALLATAAHFDCDAVHPGYGFLAENAEFAERCHAEGLTFIGPSPDMLRLFGDKVSARNAAIAAGIPVGDGSPPIDDLAHAERAAAEIGYPVMLKAMMGGGGKGMRIVRTLEALAQGFELARAEAAAAFGDPSIFLERWVERARHVEVQVAGSPSGAVIHLGDRDCSVQRNHQKLVEEAPAPGLSPELQEAVRHAAITLCEHSGYDGVGTVEFLLDADRGGFYFLEVNPRIQVEHGVTELITGLDIVELQLRIAATGDLGITQAEVAFDGAAIQCRINTEQPRLGFRASPGRVSLFHAPAGDGVRVDTHASAGYFMPPYYDSLLAKVMVHAPDRPAAIARMLDALDELQIEGVDTTAELDAWVVGHPDFAEFEVHTRWLDAGLVDGAWSP